MLLCHHHRGSLRTAGRRGWYGCHTRRRGYGCGCRCWCGLWSRLEGSRCGIQVWSLCCARWHTFRHARPRLELASVADLPCQVVHLLHELLICANCTRKECMPERLAEDETQPASDATTITVRSCSAVHYLSSGWICYMAGSYLALYFSCIISGIMSTCRRERIEDDRERGRVRKRNHPLRQIDRAR